MKGKDMDYTSEQVAKAVEAVLSQMYGECKTDRKDSDVPVGISNRHIHLTHNDVEVLFGEGHKLTPKKELSQPGQYACEEVVTLVGPSLHSIENVRVLGPERSKTQVEISVTDSYTLKVKPPVRESGNIAGSAGITIVGPCGVIRISEGCIIANRHIHMSPSDARSFGVNDGDIVAVDVIGEGNVKRTRWYGVKVRVNPDFRLEMHVDTDDANAVGIKNGFRVKLIKENENA